MRHLFKHLGLQALFIFLFMGIATAQKDSVSTYAQRLNALNALLGEEEYTKAYQYAQDQIDAILADKNYYYATDYTYYLGRLTKELYGQDKSLQAIADFEKRFLPIEKDSAKAWRQLQLEKSSFYEFLGDTKKAEQLAQKALEYTHKMPNATGRDFSLVYNNLGILNTRLGLLEKGVAYRRKALVALNTYDRATPEDFYLSYNNLGASMWYLSKMDSAAYYFSNAEKIIDSMDKTPWNENYRKATVQNNIAGVYSMQGKTEKSAKVMEKAIANLNIFLTKDITDNRRDLGYTFLFQTIENYGELFAQMGDYERTLDILEYAYERKKKYFDSSNSELANAKLFMAGAHINLKEYAKAKSLLDQAIEELQSGESYKDISTAADAYYRRALAQENLGNIDEAFNDFALSEKLFDQSQSDSYSATYLQFTQSASNFYAQNGEARKAIEMNLGQIYYDLEDFNKAQNTTKEAQFTLEKLAGSDTDNPTQNTEQQAQLLILQTKLALATEQKLDSEFLITRLAQIDKTIQELEERKSYIYSDDNSALLLERNQALFELAKELAVNLYSNTQEEQYITKLLNYHESSVYQRIRTRINRRKNVQFNNVPEDVIQNGQDIRDKMSALFAQENSSQNVISEFTGLNEDWKTYLETLSKQYPEYYTMRYASIDAKIEQLDALVPEGYSIIRYMIVGKTTYAVVIDKGHTAMIRVDLETARPMLARIHENQFNEQQSLEDLHVLYRLLWLPLEEELSTKSIIIIPDGVLYNLSFETLLKQKAASYEEMIDKSLLSEYTLAYNFSALLTATGKSNEQAANFVAFTPEFSEEMKEDYKLAVSDSVVMDKGYLQLLPQPFSRDLAENYNTIFKGDHFKNKNATKKLFVEQAGEHKIIHIGTHAESNNLSPELSRLLFAKSLDDSGSEEDNSLYTYEIYNCNLVSNLAILTACETGKPSYQAGEGMISLAHAFTYAGSESILTSLWKIDEKSSAEIVGYFYDNLKNKMPKDKALKEAKISYLQNAQGRTRHPNYWAGLVLMGDTTPLELSQSWPWWTWILVAVVALIFVVTLSRKRKRNTQN